MKLKRLFSLVSFGPVLLLAGCGAGTFTTTPSPVTIPDGVVKGVFLSGKQPVVGVSVQIYEVGTTGYGSAATPLLTPGATMTDANGNFNIPALNCHSGSSLLYLTGTGGQPVSAVGNTPAVTNNNLAMMVGLGACSTFGTQFINVNELTTVASVWALAPFMTGIANVGSSSTNAVGISNAFAAINKLVNTTNGVISGPALPANAILPINEINTLADILEQCINSGGGSASDTTDGQTNGTGCGKLFYLAGGASTTNTITAAMVIAHNPANNVAKLNALRSSSPVFQPTLSVNAPPTDWTIAISYTGGGLNSPQGVAADQAGNVWVANAGNSSVSEFASTGDALSPTAGFTAGGISAPYSLAVDQSGSVWVANSGNNSLTKLTGGTSGTAFTGNGLNAPKSIAIDTFGSVFAANGGGSTVSAFSSSGTALPGSPFAAPAGAPVAITVSPR